MGIVIIMKLTEFITELKTISKNVSKPDEIEVKMADCIPIVKPVFKNDTVFITDIEQEANKDKNL